MEGRPTPPQSSFFRTEEALQCDGFTLAVVALFVVATCVFAIQNFEIVTLSFLGFSARMPLALLVAIFYLLGMATGGSLFALLRRSIARSRFNAMSKS